MDKAMNPPYAAMHTEDFLLYICRSLCCRSWITDSHMLGIEGVDGGPGTNFKEGGGIGLNLQIVVKLFPNENYLIPSAACIIINE